MDLEIIFKLTVLIAQLCAVCAVGAFVADHIVQPAINRLSKRARQP